MAYEIHPWKVIETGFEPDKMRLSESLTSTGNGYMGMRGNFEEDYSGDTHLGTYIGGVWFPDKTRVGWWKNGYPQYFGKVINAVRLNGIHVEINGKPLDLAKADVLDFRRELDMQTGIFSRHFTLWTPNGKIEVKAERFVSLAQKELLAVNYSITPEFEADIVMKPYLDANVRNLDSNYDETFWDMLQEEQTEDALALLTKTKENPFGAPRFAVAAGLSCWSDQLELKERKLDEGYVELTYAGKAAAGETVSLEKFALCFTDRDHEENLLVTMAVKAASRARETGYEDLKKEHVEAWKQRWSTCDVTIEGDDAAQQGIRFNLFQLLSTYSGEDARLNIGPKGFTGEKYGGATYWDTEAYCLPVYMAVAGQDVARQLLLYRYLQLDGAYFNAKQQGLKGALYPMVTFTGIECHNEWEITFEEIHRNGAIAHAIFDYATYTGDEEYPVKEGLDVLCGIARFYTDRCHFSKRKGKYMIHGVTGPNEYENNVNNNWYTNRIAAWSIAYFLEQAEKAGEARRAELNITPNEMAHMQDVVESMYYPEDKELGIFVQHDTFLDKDLEPAAALPAEERPINQHWSWDHILRSLLHQAGGRAAGPVFPQSPVRHGDHPPQLRLLRAHDRAREQPVSLRTQHSGGPAGLPGEGRGNVPAHRPPRLGQHQQRHRGRPAYHQHGRQLAVDGPRLRGNAHRERPEPESLPARLLEGLRLPVPVPRPGHPAGREARQGHRPSAGRPARGNDPLR